MVFRKLRNIIRVLSNITEEDLQRLDIEVERRKQPIKVIRIKKREERRVEKFLKENKFNNVNLEDIYDA